MLQCTFGGAMQGRDLTERMAPVMVAVTTGTPFFRFLSNSTPRRCSTSDAGRAGSHCISGARMRTSCGPGGKGDGVRGGRGTWRGREQAALAAFLARIGPAYVEPCVHHGRLRRSRNPPPPPAGSSYGSLPRGGGALGREGARAQAQTSAEDGARKKVQLTAPTPPAASRTLPALPARAEGRDGIMLIRSWELLPTPGAGFRFKLVARCQVVHSRGVPPVAIFNQFAILGRARSPSREQRHLPA